MHAAFQDTVIVSLHDYPAFGETELTMCISEQLTIAKKYDTMSFVKSDKLNRIMSNSKNLLMTAILPDSDGEFLSVRSATTGRESYIPTTYTARVTHK